MDEKLKNLISLLFYQSTITALHGSFGRINSTTKIVYLLPDLSFTTVI